MYVPQHTFAWKSMAYRPKSKTPGIGVCYARYARNGGCRPRFGYLVSTAVLLAKIERNVHIFLPWASARNPKNYQELYPIYIRTSTPLWHRMLRQRTAHRESPFTGVNNFPSTIMRSYVRTLLLKAYDVPRTALTVLIVRLARLGRKPRSCPEPERVMYKYSLPYTVTVVYRSGMLCFLVCLAFVA